MKKLVFIMPLMAISLLASCGGSKKPGIAFDGGEYLTIDNTEYKNLTEFSAKISVKDEYLGKYEVPQNEAYYEITRDNVDINNFQIVKDDGFNSVYLKIPKEEMTGHISIKVEGFCHYLTFTAVDAGATIYYDLSGPNPPSVLPKLQYCTNLDTPNWADWTFGEEGTILLNAVGETIYIRNTIDTFSEINKTVRFETNDSSLKISANGNIMSLINFTELSENCFDHLFSFFKSLISAPVLPATTLTDYCYKGMFSNCTSLITPPELPATTLARGCYTDMFIKCSSLITTPELPATTLKRSCYGGMFEDCTSLTTAPVLPATKLDGNCYDSMFCGCILLKISENIGEHKIFTCPEVVAQSESVDGMFRGTGGSYQDDPTEGNTYYWNE